MIPLSLVIDSPETLSHSLSVQLIDDSGLDNVLLLEMTNRDVAQLLPVSPMFSPSRKQEIYLSTIIIEVD